MGNCLDRPRGARVVGVDGGGAHCARRSAMWVEEEVAAKAKEEQEPRKSEGTPAGTEVKIRITKKQLEELLRRVEDGKDAGGSGGVPVREVISELLCMASSSSNFRHRADDGGQWRPSLQSIPE